MIDKTRIMVVDDQNLSIETFKVLLESDGEYVVEGFVRPEEALRSLKERAGDLPSIIIADIVMPGMDGYQFGQELRKDYRLCPIPLIYLSIRSEVSDKIEARTLTPHFFPKNGDRSELLSLIKSILFETTVQGAVNPLTKLPGNAMIERTVNDVVKTRERYAIYYVDGDNFKAYNDVYGPYLGDQAIKEIARALDRALQQAARGAYFLGHLGGDDFIVVIWSDASPETVCKKIFREIDIVHKAIYSEEDLKRRYFESVNRRGARERFNLLSVSIGVVSNTVKHVTGWAEASNFLSEVKKKAKSQKGNSYCIDSRKK